MCTVVVLRRPAHDWPLLLAANRDERLDRAWDPPAAWWPEWPGVVGGRDRTAGGAWMALGPAGVVGAVLNRPGSLGPAAGKQSRGALPLLAAAARSAQEAVERVLTLRLERWRPFNLVVADTSSAICLRGFGDGTATVDLLGDGVTMVTAHDPNDLGSPRIARHLPRFRAADAPQPDRDDWASWEALLADDSVGRSRADTLFVPPSDGFGTLASSLIGLAADGRREWRFAGGARGAPFRRVA